MVKTPPTRADLTELDRLARRMLNKHRDQDLRVLCKRVLVLIDTLDQYVESVYPCFDLFEAEIRKNGGTLGLEKDGVWRLRSTDESVLCTGPSVREFFINIVLWMGDWSEDEEYAELTYEEDLTVEGLSMDRGPNAGGK